VSEVRSEIAAPNGTAAGNGASGGANGGSAETADDGTPAGPGGGRIRRGGLALVPHTDVKQTTKDFKTDQDVRWCPWCGDYAILAAVQSFMPELGLRRENIVFVSGIGCSSRFPYYMNTYGFHSIHGRAPAIATGLAASRPDLSVWVVTGDGDALSIGGNHLIHALRRNVNLKILLFNNRIYGLTKGQYSPTSEVGKITKSTPLGSLDAPFNPISLAIGAEASFVARTLDSDRKHLQTVLRAATEHKGAALVEIYQNCNIFNDNAFEPLKDPTTRDEVTVKLEHGEPLIFGKSDRKAIVRSADGGLGIVAADSVSEGEVIVHNAYTPDPSLAFALSRLDSPTFGHTPIGIFRQVERPSYDELMDQQLAGAVAKKGEGDLAALLGSGDTWQID
jgi:2-oxoglutarate/2-oxoacid ferredoxin oxidoreductase subunit beta